MSCYAYEKLNNCFITDPAFDALGFWLYEHWDTLKHRHKKYIDPEGVYCTSALTVEYHELPLIVLMATHRILKTEFKTSPIYEEAMQEALFREFI